ncbi:MAG: SDR family oxidoreductase [Candidatus Wallbacteria bacterium]|nr:SDR family oxidoreductase [Candidatus Wallbacteria bacterium]
MRILITGASGNLGAYLLRHFRNSEHEVTAWSGGWRGELFGVGVEPVELSDAPAVARAFDRAAPDVVIHAAAVSAIDLCHGNPERAMAVNASAAGWLLTLAAGRRFVQVSTDLVFSGEKGDYRESEQAEPLSVYGRSKRAAEPAVTACWFAQSLVVRLGLLYGPSLTGRPNFFDRTVLALEAGRALTLFDDEWRNPLGLAAAAAALAGIATSDFVPFREIHHARILHVAGPERLSRYELGCRIAAVRGLPTGSLVRGSRADHLAPEPRPRDTTLDCSRWRQLFPHHDWPSVESGLEAMGAGRP